MGKKEQEYCITVMRFLCVFNHGNGVNQVRIGIETVILIQLVIIIYTFTEIPHHLCIPPTIPIIIIILFKREIEGGGRRGGEWLSNLKVAIKIMRVCE